VTRQRIGCDWPACGPRLLAGVAERAVESKWTGPLVLDEIRYLVLQSPELRSVLQQFMDHDAKRARMTVAIAGSSQRMMQGLVMNASAPLFGRARELLTLRPLPPAYARDAFGNQDSANRSVEFNRIMQIRTTR
jgi:hypothetical protein